MKDERPVTTMLAGVSFEGRDQTIFLAFYSRDVFLFFFFFLFFNEKNIIS